MSGISFIGFDIYSSSDQVSVENYLYNYPPSKPIWIAEAWSAQTPRRKPGQAQSDAQWMKSFYSYAQSIKAKMLIPFYTDLFSGYTVPYQLQRSRQPSTKVEAPSTRRSTTW